MAEIVNLRTARKAKARSAARTTADGNAAKFGRGRFNRDFWETKRLRNKWNLPTVGKGLHALNDRLPLG